MTGYSLKQLLTWCSENRLIDSYHREQGFIEISARNSNHKLTPEQARPFLLKLLKDDLPHNGSVFRTGTDRNRG